MTTPKLVEHFFRHEYGRLVSVLSRRVGVQHIETVEDAAQYALMRALESWTIEGLPGNPSAWVYSVARNKLLDELRQRSGHERILNQNAPALVEALEVDQEYFLSGELRDEMLCMLFACCDESIPVESQLALALKTLCGFNVREIAIRLFTTDANVYKRLTRARNRLQHIGPHFIELALTDHAPRLSSVYKILYLLFTEGYLSYNTEFAIRRELCEEAIRLTHILANHAIGQTPEAFALLALMHLHMARLNARQDGTGGLLLLEEQDRALWDQHQIQMGLWWLEKSASGDTFSRYHAEAGIAAEHCLSPSFHETRWDRVVDCYLLLENTAPSAIHRLNRAVAVAEWRGPAAGLAVLKEVEPPKWLIGSYLWSAVQADLHLRCGDHKKATRYREEALSNAPTPAVKALLERRLKADGF